MCGLKQPARSSEVVLIPGPPSVKKLNFSISIFCSALKKYRFELQISIILETFKGDMIL